MNICAVWVTSTIAWRETRSLRTPAYGVSSTAGKSPEKVANPSHVPELVRSNRSAGTATSCIQLAPFETAAAVKKIVKSRWRKMLSELCRPGAGGAASSVTTCSLVEQPPRQRVDHTRRFGIDGVTVQRALDRDADQRLDPASHVADLDQFGATPHPRADRHRRRVSHLARPVVDARREALHLDDLGQEEVGQREREVPVGDRATEWSG